MRGKAFCDRHSVDQVGITPAYAGKSQKTALQKLPRQDHPRLCGEKGNNEVCGWVTGGSPPPMRGKDDITSFYNSAYGITPAYAGKSLNSLHAASFFWDHPRLCGEKTEAALRTLEAKGSPPPMRGKAFRWIHVVPCQGITPAYAGKR